MTELTFPQHGDLPDAAHWAFSYGAPAVSRIVSGFGLTVDFSIPEVDVGAGKAVIDRGTMTTAHPTIDPPENLRESVAIAQVDSQIIALSDNAVNHLFLRANIADDDSPQVVSNTTNSKPTSASFKIGEVDTAANSTRAQWRLVADGRTLTFPDKAAADEISPQLAKGSIVFERKNDTHFFVS
jgi:hypothetical protein